MFPTTILIDMHSVTKSISTAVASKQPILIIEAGLGGLALAQGLRKSGIDFKIFERSPATGFRPQGYRIRLHGDGLVGLRSVLPDNVWNLFEQTCAETRLGMGPNLDAVSGAILPRRGNVGGPGGPSPLSISGDQVPRTVDRSVMREVLLTGLEKNIFNEKHFEKFSLTNSGDVATFADGSTEAGSLLIGADGVRSAVRKQYLPQMKILDMRGHLIYGKTPLTPGFENKILSAAAERMSGIRDHKLGTVTLMEAIRFPPVGQLPEKPALPKDYMYWVMALPGVNSPITEDELRGLSNKQAADVADRLTRHWHPSLRPLIDYQDSSQTGVFRMLSSMGEIQPWGPDARVTLLGDAAHTMIPPAASGAVTAMRDAALLTSLIRDEGISATTIGRYESEMRRYSGETVNISAKVGQIIFGQKPLSECEVAEL